MSGENIISAEGKKPSLSEDISKLSFRKINQSKKTIFCEMLCIFLFMLLLNHLTLMLTDDYIYCFSFATGERITSIWQIFPSMRQHYFTMNGRLILHFLVQALLMLPAFVFDVLNAAMFCLMIGLIYYYACYFPAKKHNAFLLFTIAALIWKFTPAFGHVYLWLDGSVNYLWAVVFALAYMLPLIKDMCKVTVFNQKWKKILYAITGFAVGAMSETLSMAVMGVLFFTILAQIIVKKEKPQFWTMSALLLCMSGYLLMMVSPGTWNSKAGGSSSIGDQFFNVLNTYVSKLGLLIILWIVLMAASIYCKRSRISIMISSVFMLLSLCINFLHITAARYPGRSMIGPTVFLIIAVTRLLGQFWNDRCQLPVACICALSICLASVQFFPGVNDILNTYRQCLERENYIVSERDKGNLELEIEVLDVDTKYSAAKGLRYLQTDTWNDWPNVYMANYWGVASITGVK